MKSFQVFSVSPRIPEKIAFLETLARNLWWCWSMDARQLLRRIDPALWREVSHSPLEYLRRLPLATLESLAEDDAFCAALKAVQAKLEGHLEKAAVQAAKTGITRVGYFSLEYGMHESVRLYSGGLGVLAGDHLKSASDTGTPITAVGLFYHQGYFRQYLDDSGWQQERYPESDMRNLPMSRMNGADGLPARVSVPLPGGQILADVWKLNVGAVPLILLDANIPENPPELRGVTARLYGGDKLNRLRQELLLGVGGFKALVQLGLEPEVCHLNEGHAAFLSLARIAHLVHARGLDINSAFEVASRAAVFTTHTPVPAGNETFPIDLLRPHLEALAKETGIAADQVIDWGRAPGDAESPELSMTILGLRLAQRSNGVSRLHGKVSRGMWRHLWPDRMEEELPIRHVTNGVHCPTWISEENAALLERYVGSDWDEGCADAETLARIDDIPNEEIWLAHERARDRMIRLCRERMERQFAARNAPAAKLKEMRSVLEREALTIGFARRSAEYKRGRFLLAEPDRLAALLKSKDRPVQFIFAGKAHPADEPGKKIIQEIVEFTRREGLGRHIIFVEDYDMRLARFLVQGVDVWLNTPRRPHEASGTSGMKAAINGVLHASILDGWWDEGYAPNCGYAIGGGENYDDAGYGDAVEVHALYNLLEDQIIPRFYDRPGGGDPEKWVGMMKASMKMALSKFSSRRMVLDYQRDLYRPAAEDYRQLIADDGALARKLATERQQLNATWSEVSVDPPVPDQDLSALHLGDSFGVSVKVRLPHSNPDQVDVEVCCGDVDGQGVLKSGKFQTLQHAGELKDGTHEFRGEIACDRSGRFGLTARATPKGDAWSRAIPGFVSWAD
ncbi:MAG: alpha-glucan family phosphorylase [Verrucomicrobiales bacterium]